MSGSESIADQAEAVVIGLHEQIDVIDKKLEKNRADLRQVRHEAFGHKAPAADNLVDTLITEAGELRAKRNEFETLLVEAEAEHAAAVAAERDHALKAEAAKRDQHRADELERLDGEYQCAEAELQRGVALIATDFRAGNTMKIEAQNRMREINHARLQLLAQQNETAVAAAVIGSKTHERLKQERPIDLSDPANLAGSKAWIKRQKEKAGV